MRELVLGLIATQDRTASLGFIVDDLNRFSGRLRIRYLGEAPLLEDDSVHSDASLLLNAQAL